MPDAALTPARSASYGVACTYEGKPMEWRSLGTFHASPMAANNWDKYRAKVVEKASKRGCPGVAVRSCRRARISRAKPSARGA